MQTIACEEFHLWRFNSDAFDKSVDVTDVP